MGDKNINDGERFPIRELSARTQVNTVTIRAWERRYGLLKPERTAKGHRLYSEEDVSTIEKIIELVARGVPLSKVKPLLKAESYSQTEESESSNWDDLVKTLVAAVSSFSHNKVEHLINEFFANFPVRVCREKLLEPAVVELLRFNDSKAAYGFAESELIRYAALRLSKKGNKNHRGAPLVLICGEKTPIWRLAMVAMELDDAGCSVLLMNCNFTLPAGLKLAAELQTSITVFYQDGIWTEKEAEKVKEALISNDKLILCGTAPVLANVTINDRVFSSLESVIPQLLSD